MPQHRRSQIELLDQLNSLFDSLDASSSSRPTSPLLPLSDPSPTASSAAPRTAPLRLVPALLDAFEQKRGVQLLAFEEKEQLRELVRGLPEGMEDQPVGVEQLFDLLVGLGVTTGSGLTAAQPSQEEGERTPSMTAIAASLAAAASSTTTTTTPTVPPPPTPTAGMLRPDAASYRNGDGSPVRRPSRRAPPSASSSSSSSTTSARTSGTASPLLLGGGASSTSSHIPVPISRRRTIPRSSVPGLANPVLGSNSPRTLRSRRTLEDLSRLAKQEGGSYLGVALDGEEGREGGDSGGAEERSEEEIAALVKRARIVLSGKGPSREQDLLTLLAPLTPKQLKALNLAYANPSDESKQQSSPSRTLLVTVLADRGIKGTAELALRGLLMGPLAFDVYLVQKALDGAATNDALLIDLLIGRPPSSLALLRAAFAERTSPDSRSASAVGSPAPSSSSSAASSTASPAGRSHTRSLDVAVLSAYSSNTRVRKAWEVALKGRWADAPSLVATEPLGAGEEGGDGDETGEKLLKEAVDQLKVALRRGGSTEMIAKILLARSPVHLRKLCDEFALSTGGNSTLTRAIKQSVPSGVLQRLFLHAVEAAKHVSDTNGVYGVWRDAKMLQRVMDGTPPPTTTTKRDEELVVRLVRLRWDRTRFGLVQKAYERKYRISLASRLEQILPSTGSVAETMRLLLDVATAPNVAAPRSSSSGTPPSSDEPPAHVSTSPDGPASHNGSETGSDRDAAELEAEGELSDPPSPRSPPTTAPVGAEPTDLDTFGREQPEEASTVGELARSTSSLSTRSETSFDRPSSAMSSRSRTSITDGHGPSSSSSANASADTSRLSSSLRHSRPMAPSRAKRRQSEEMARSQRSGSEEPLSPREDGVISPTLSHASRGSLSRSSSMAASDMSLSSSTASRHSSEGGQALSGLDHNNDSTNAIDTSSFFATPLSPIRDESRPSSIFFPDNHSSTPPPAPPPPFDPDLDKTDFFATVTGTPDSPERFFSSLMRRDASQTSNASANGSRPSSLFGDGMLDSFLANPAGHARDGSGTIRGNEQFQQLLRHAQDLAKKLKDNESRFHASASQFESEVADLEGQLEEARSELHAKRREEKDLRSVEKEHLQQIGLLEGEVAQLNKSLERSREAYETMKRSYTSTCDEADRLRTLVAELRRENRNAEETIQGHSLQVQQFERDHDRLQQAVDKLESELASARQAQDALENQKQENLLLKETIDKLRFEIEEMQSIGPKSGFIDSSQQAFLSPSKSLAESISKSIGREIATQMSTAEDEESDEEDEAIEREDAADDMDDIIVTTHRRIRKRGKRSNAMPEPIVRVDATIDMADADCQTAGPSYSEMTVQTDLTAVNSELVEKPPVAEEPPQPKRSTRQMQDDLASQLGVNVDLIKQLAEAKQAGAEVSVTRAPTEVLPSTPLPSRRSPRWRSRFASVPAAKAPAYLVNVFPNSARPYVAQLLDSGLSLVLYTAIIYLIGVLSGSRFVPLHHRHYISPVDFGLYSPDGPRWEGLAVGAGADGGFAPEGFARILYDALWSGVRSSRRVPI
ncbi:hypothetical protein JCM10908_003889 [Rhodotorula pacifica]|uniref:uncharacterized protein n=1 Tax=Rhodotorula pacifica TaxID=1495444 RepID=UPI0031765B21